MKPYEKIKNVYLAKTSEGLVCDLTSVSSTKLKPYPEP